MSWNSSINRCLNGRNNSDCESNRPPSSAMNRKQRLYVNFPVDSSTSLKALQNCASARTKKCSTCSDEIDSMLPTTSFTSNPRLSMNEPCDQNTADNGS